jgi:hypothetical protein
MIDAAALDIDTTGKLVGDLWCAGRQRDNLANELAALREAAGLPESQVDVANLSRPKLLAVEAYREELGRTELFVRVREFEAKTTALAWANGCIGKQLLEYSEEVNSRGEHIGAMMGALRIAESFIAAELELRQHALFPPEESEYVAEAERALKAVREALEE